VVPTVTTISSRVNVEASGTHSYQSHIKGEMEVFGETDRYKKIFCENESHIFL
jgi:hypothetical protein